MNLNVRRAELALGRADHASARSLLDEVADIGSVVDEPQWSGPLGALRAELERREGNLDAARAAVRRALSSIEARSEDAARPARLSATGATVEADAAQLARDLGDADAERAALAEVERHVARARDAAERGGPLARAWLLVAMAERTRAAAGGADPEAFGAAAEAWDALERPVPAATMRLRMAEAHIRAGDRAAASDEAKAARRAAMRIGAEWVRAEVEGLAARARLGLVDARSPAAPQPEPVTDDPPRADRARAPGPRACCPWRDESRDRRGALHGGEDGERARVADPRQARRAHAHRSGGSRKPPAPGQLSRGARGAGVVRPS
jgi:hypothetical protein